MEWQPLDFERPIFELERRLQDLKNHSDKHDVDLDSAIKELETTLRETRHQIYGNLTAWQRVQIARHVQRPFALDYIERCRVVWPHSAPNVALLSLIKKGATQRRTSCAILVARILRGTAKRCD